MAVLILKIEYDGTDYVGWQRQAKGRSIQGCIEDALYNVFNERLTLISAGRTDAGVHAGGQVAHAKIPNPTYNDKNQIGINDVYLPSEKIPIAINSQLKPDIRILGAIITDKRFHSRYDAVERLYVYYITQKESVFYNRYRAFIKYKLNEELLIASADIFKGERDFTTFSKHNYSTHSYVCNVKDCRWEKIDEYNWKFSIRANRFVYGMVRAIVGACLDIARGKRTMEEISEALEKKDRRYISPLAPVNGLFLEKVFYNTDIGFLDKI